MNKDKIFNINKAIFFKNIIINRFSQESMVKKQGCMYTWWALLLLDSLRDAVLLILLYFFPHPERIKKMYNLKPDSRFVYFYYFLYPFRAMFGGLKPR